MRVAATRIVVGPYTRFPVDPMDQLSSKISYKSVVGVTGFPPATYNVPKAQSGVEVSAIIDKVMRLRNALSSRQRRWFAALNFDGIFDGIDIRVVQKIPTKTALSGDDVDPSL